jgi:uncharacterized BrkB/YihY/UPF0761 family membrane protein
MNFDYQNLMTILFTALTCAITFYILVEGFQWKPKYAVFGSFFAPVVMPIFMVCIAIYIIGDTLRSFCNFVINLGSPKQVRKA